MANPEQHQRSGEVTLALDAHARGDEGALDRVFDLVYEELSSLARAKLRHNAGMSLETVDLVNEVYLRLVGSSARPENRGHFFALSARAMRQIIVDRARYHLRHKRGGAARPTTLRDHHSARDARVAEVLAVDQALRRLATVDEKLLRTVECRYFAGFTEKETASALGVNIRSVSRYWGKARNWLKAELATP